MTQLFLLFPSETSRLEKMKKYYHNWWTQRWYDEFKSRWRGPAKAWTRGLADYEVGKLGRTDFDQLSGEFSGKIFDSNIKPFYRPVLIFPKLIGDESSSIYEWFVKNPRALTDLFGGKLSEDLPGLITDSLFRHSVKSFYCNCGCSSEYCSHLCTLIFSFLETIDQEPLVLFHYLGLNLEPLLPRSIREALKDKIELQISLSDLLSGLTEKVQVNNSSVTSGFPNIIDTLNSSPSYLHTVSSLFSDSRTFLEKGDLRELVQNCLLDAQHLLKSKKTISSKSNCWEQSLFVFDDFASRLGVIEKNIDASQQLLDRSLLTERFLSYGPMPPSVELLVQVAQIIIEKGACLPLIFKADDLSLNLPRLLWVPAVNEPSLNLAFKELFKLDSLSDIEKMVEVRSLKSVVAFRVLLNDDSTQSNEKAAARRALIIYLIAQIITGFIELAADPSSVKGLVSAMLLGRNIGALEGLVNQKVAAEIVKLFQIPMAPYILFSKPLVTITDEPETNINATDGKHGYRIDFGFYSGSSLQDLTQKDRGTEAAFFTQDIASKVQFSKYRLLCIRFLKVLSAQNSVFDTLAYRLTPYLSDDFQALKSFLVDCVPKMLMLGIRVVMDKRFKKIIRPTLHIYASKGDDGKVISFFGNMDFSAQLSVDGKPLTDSEAKKLLSLMPAEAQESVIVNFQDQLIELDPQEVGTFNKMREKVKRLNPFEQLKSVIVNNWNGYGITLSQEIEQNLADILNVPEIDLPKSIQATLRPYQIVGYQWLMKNITKKMGALIADDMGLGKTLQVICAITKCCEDSLFADKPILVVVPAGVLHNWKAEFKKFSSTLDVRFSLDADVTHPSKSTDPMPDVVLTTYSTLTIHFELFAEKEWGLVVADEAQYLKNPASARSKAFRLLKSDEMIAMTGTPIENRLMDLWSIFTCIQPKLLGDQKDFIRDYAIPIEAYKNQKVSENLRKIIAPFVLRREKTDPAIICDLPKCAVNNVPVKLTPLQAYLYKEAVNKYLDQIIQQERKKGILTIRLLTDLKQICNSPSQFLKRNAEQPDSGKAVTLIKMLGALLAKGKKVLIFTQYYQMGLKLQDWIEKTIGERPEFLNGSMPLNARSSLIKRFQQDANRKILIVSLKAGGVGLNLTAASVVIHYDLWWNPAVEQQATDRAYRIGQNKDVTVYRMICEGSFEERIDEVITKKRELARNINVKTDKWLGELSPQELEEFFKLI